MSNTSKDSLFPFGKVISAVSPIAFPNRPFAIGVFTEIFPVFRSLSLSGTNVNTCSCLVAFIFKFHCC